MSKQHILQTARPSTLCTYLMFQHRGLFFVPDLMSGLKKTSQESSLTMMKTQMYKQIRGIANQGSFARHLNQP